MRPPDRSRTSIGHSERRHLAMARSSTNRRPERSAARPRGRLSQPKGIAYADALCGISPTIVRPSRLAIKPAWLRCDCRWGGFHVKSSLAWQAKGAGSSLCVTSRDSSGARSLWRRQSRTDRPSSPSRVSCRNPAVKGLSSLMPCSAPARNPLTASVVAQGQPGCHCGDRSPRFAPALAAWSHLAEQRIRRIDVAAADLAIESEHIADSHRRCLAGLPERLHIGLLLGHSFLFSSANCRLEARFGRGNRRADLVARFFAGGFTPVPTRSRCFRVVSSPAAAHGLSAP